MAFTQDPVSLPRDAKLLSLLLESLGIHDYDPLVIHQLLELSNRHMTDLLQDAQVYSEHAEKKEMTVEDVKLAVEAQVMSSFTSPPSKDVYILFSPKKT